MQGIFGDPSYSKRFAFFVGRGCRAMTIKDVAQETHLDWKIIKELDKQYMREQLRRIGTPTPKSLGWTKFHAQETHLSHRSKTACPDIADRFG